MSEAAFNGVLNDQQLEQVVEALAAVHKEILPQGASLFVVMDQIMEATPKDDPRGMFGLVRCLGAGPAEAVYVSLSELRYAFGVLRLRLMPREDAAAPQDPKQLLHGMAVATLELKQLAQELMQSGQLTPQQIEEINKELALIEQVDGTPASAPEVKESLEALRAEGAKLDAELMAEAVAMLKAANIDPNEIMPLMPKAEEPPPPEEPKVKGGQSGSNGDTPSEKVASEAEVKAQMQEADQQAKGQVADLQKQLSDAGFDVSEVAEFFKSL